MNEYTYDLSFRIKHPYFDPEDICLTLGMDAKHKWKKGEQRRTVSGDVLKGTYHETYCCFELEAGNDSLVKALQNMNSKLQLCGLFLREIRETGGGMEYFIGMYFERNTGEVFDCALMGELSELGISLALDLYGESNS